MNTPVFVWLYRALTAGVLCVLLVAVFAHVGHLRALIQGQDKVQSSPWTEVCTPQGIQRVAMDVGS